MVKLQEQEMKGSYKFNGTPVMTRGFSEKFGALRCRELLQNKFTPDDTTPAAKAMGLTGHCDIMIVTAVEIVEELLAERA